MKMVMYSWMYILPHTIYHIEELNIPLYHFEYTSLLYTRYPKVSHVKNFI